MGKICPTDIMVVLDLEPERCAPPRGRGCEIVRSCFFEGTIVLLVRSYVCISEDATSPSTRSAGEAGARHRTDIPASRRSSLARIETRSPRVVWYVARAQGGRPDMYTCIIHADASTTRSPQTHNTPTSTSRSRNAGPTPNAHRPRLPRS
ncbi:hypothetical protein FKP32DRAFT_1313913 [Trametes sanguinea]|nr:hypothetical protein FKP32DRAFT_1313913 [Trametes sanguinea]